MVEEKALKIELWSKKSPISTKVWLQFSVGLVLFLFFLFYSLATITRVVPFSHGLEAVKSSDGASWRVEQVNNRNKAVGIKKADLVVRADGKLPTTLDELNHAKVLELIRPNDAALPKVFSVSEQDYITNNDYGFEAQFVYLFVALVCFIVSSLVLFQARERQASFIFFLLCLSIAVTLFELICIYNGQQFLSKPSTFGVNMTIATLFHFFAIFPKVESWWQIPFLRGRLNLNFWIKLNYIFAAIAGIALLLDILKILPNSSALSDLHAIIFWSGGILVGVLKLFLKKAPQAQAETRFMVITLVASFGPFLLLGFLPNLFSQNLILIASRYLIGAFALLPIGLAWAVVQYKSLGVTRLFNRNLTYALLTLTLFGIYSVFYLVAERNFGQWVGQNQLVLLILFSFITVLTFNRLQIWLQKLVDTLIFRDYYNYQTEVKKITAELAQPVRLDDVVNLVLTEFTRTLNSEFAALTIYKREEQERDRVYLRKIFKHANNPPEMQINLPFIDDLRFSTPDITYVINAPGSTAPLIGLEMNLDEEFYTTLTLGAKRSGEIYSATDVALIETLVSVVKVKLHNALLINVLEKQVLELASYSEQLRTSKDQLQLANEQVVKVAEEERSRLARELHDEPLQRLMMVLRQFDAGSEDITPRELFCWNIVKEVSQTLRTICFYLRPPILDDLGLIAALESLAGRTRKESGLAIELLIDFVLEEKRFNPGVEVVLYRVAQEALQNVIKHAAAKKVILELRELSDSTIMLRIQDDGRGFKQPLNINELLRDSHLGLVGSRERIHSLGGKLEIMSRPGEGVTLEAYLDAF